MSEWIKCSDELPPIDAPVFLHAGKIAGIGARASLNDGTWGWGWSLSEPILDEAGWFVEGYELDDFEPSHWHPLPTPLGSLP